MPELPEVETIRRDLEKKILDKKISVVEVYNAKVVKMDRHSFVELLRGKKIKAIDRRGKLMIFHLSDGKHYLLIHLKMTGQLLYQYDRKLLAGGHSFSELETDLPNRYTRVRFRFADGSILYFNDLRRFGFLKLVDEKGKEQVLRQYGLEPLQPEFTFQAFQQALDKRKTSLKAVMLNQQLIAGIGNIYADEICFAAGVRPWRKVSSLRRDDLKRLYHACKKVLRLAIAKRGTTFNNYVDANGQRGNFLRYLKVYDQEGKPCKRCHMIIEKRVVAGRGTHYCLQCQR